MVKQAPRISVAMATYQGERFLVAQLESILSQSRTVDEIVIADDGSTDRTHEIISSFAAQGAPIRMLPIGQRLGAAGGFQRAMLACEGDLIFLSDQDDVWDSEKVAILTDAMASTGAWCANSDARLIDDSGAPLGSTAFESLRISSTESKALAMGSPYQHLLKRNVFTGTTMAVTRELRDKALPIPPMWLHDEWLAIIGSALGRTTTVFDQLVDYRQHNNNVVGLRKLSGLGRFGKVFENRGDRLATLASRSESLVLRLRELNCDDAVLGRTLGKVEFDVTRARFKGSRLHRVPQVLALAATGTYPEYASQGWADIWRDLLQPSR